MNLRKIPQREYLVAIHKQNVCWDWKKICKLKEVFKWGSSTKRKWDWDETKDGEYSIKIGYKWLMNDQQKLK